MILLEQAKTAEALESERQALAIYEKLAASDPQNKQARRSLSRTYEKIGNVMMYNADVVSALELNRKALAIRSDLSTENPNNADFRRGVGISHEKIGDMLTKLNRPVEALAYHRKALKMRNESAAKDSSNLWKRWDMIESTAKVARLLAIADDKQGALEYCRKTEALVEATPDASTEMYFRRYRAAAYAELGGALETIASNKAIPAEQKLNHWRVARAFYQRSLDSWIEMRNRGLLTPIDASKPAEIASQIARCDGALAKLLE